MDKSKLSVILLGSTIFFAIALVLYWFVYLQEPLSTTKKTNNTQDTALPHEDEETTDEEIYTKPVQTRKNETYNEPLPVAEEETAPTTYQQPERVEIVKTDEKSSNLSLINRYDDSLQAFLQAGNKADLVNYLNRLLRNIKYSSKNEVVVRSLMSQFTLKKALGTASIKYFSQANNTGSDNINIKQLIKIAQNLTPGIVIKFDEMTAKIEGNKIESIEVQEGY